MQKIRDTVDIHLDQQNRNFGSLYSPHTIQSKPPLSHLCKFNTIPCVMMLSTRQSTAHCSLLLGKPHAHTHKHTHVHTHEDMPNTHAHTHAHAHMHAHTLTHVPMHTRTHMNTRTYEHMHTRTSTCMRARTCMHTHEHVHSCARRTSRETPASLSPQ